MKPGKISVKMVDCWDLFQDLQNANVLSTELQSLVTNPPNIWFLSLYGGIKQYVVVVVAYVFFWSSERSMKYLIHIVLKMCMISMTEKHHTHTYRIDIKCKIILISSVKCILISYVFHNAIYCYCHFYSVVK